MVSARTVRSLRAQRDLEDIFAYIVENSGPYQAAGVLRRIEEAMVLLGHAPRLGRVRDDLEGAPHSFSVRPWAILYDALPDDAGVFILRVVDGRRDLSQI